MHPVLTDIVCTSQHMAAGALNFRAKPNAQTWDYLLRPLGGAVALAKWLYQGFGTPLAAQGAQLILFLRSDDERCVYSHLEGARTY